MSNIETIRGNSVNKINAEAHTVEFQNGDGVACNGWYRMSLGKLRIR